MWNSSLFRNRCYLCTYLLINKKDINIFFFSASSLSTRPYWFPGKNILSE